MAKPHALPFLLVAIATTLATLLPPCHADEPISLSTQECVRMSANTKPNYTAVPALESIQANVELWQGVVLMICFGAFALLIALVHRIVRSYVYYDAHLLDTYFDAGGDVNFALISCMVLAKYAWTTSYTWSSMDTAKYGLVGGFWYAAAMVVHIFLFAIVACEIRIKAPGAKTFLQVIYKRHGTAAHIIVLIFALFVNVVVSGIAMTEGTRIIAVLTDGLSKEVACVILSVVVGFFTVVGGLGGAIYVSYFGAGLVLVLLLVYMTDIYFDPLGRDGNVFGAWESVWEAVQCGRGDPGNEDDGSILTFLSKNGMVQGIIIMLSGFSSVFVNQSFWQTAVAAKPGSTVWGFLLGGMTWFAVPLSGSFVFGMVYWVYSLDEGAHLLSEEDMRLGYLPVYVSQRLWGSTGDFLMYVLTLVVVVMAAASEVLAVSSIIIYDIYQTYISPFRPSGITENKEVALRTRRAVQNEEYLEYDRRCVVLKHFVVVCVTCVLIPVTLVLIKINIDLEWLFMFLGVFAGSFAMPVALAITWHRITASGIISGGLTGFVAGVVAWLAYAATYDGGLERFRVNTGQANVMLVGSAVSLGVGGLLCIIVSLSCGGCDSTLQEEEEWEKTRMIDNPILPWAVKYAPDIREFGRSKGTPHFYTVRRTYKMAEISAYIVGVLFAVCAVLVWPACMLLADVFTMAAFERWYLMIFIWLVAATAFTLLVPLIAEVVQVCQQAYYNRAWQRAEKHQRLDEEGSTDPNPAPNHRPLDTNSLKTDSDFTSTMGQSSMDTGKERWKTFITLD